MHCLQLKLLETPEKKYKELGDNFIGPSDYLNKFGLQKIFYNPQKITFSHNNDKPIHRWSPYLEGFSSNFVENKLAELNIKKGDHVLDPFAGCGTVNVCAKMAGIESTGVEINPLMHFILKTKCEWNIKTNQIVKTLQSIDWDQNHSISPPDFLLSERQFNPDTLEKLLILKEQINHINNSKIRNIFLMAFSSILLRCSNLKRSPSIAYKRGKNVTVDSVEDLFIKKMNQIISDLQFVQKKTKAKEKTHSNIILGDSQTVKHDKEVFDLAITSPPYLNFIDYVMNYKLELGWLGFAKSQADLRMLKDQMVVCDNVSRPLTQEFRKKGGIYTNDWLEEITGKLEAKMQENKKLRRNDYDIIVRKYFNDLFNVMKNVYFSLKYKSKFLIVVGDSLISGVYVPTDLLLAKLGEDIGFKVDKIEIVRERRSGVKRFFKLRESILHLVK